MFLSIFTFFTVKPILPILKDTIAHVFNEFEHVSTIHFENGKYHLHAELVSEAKENTNEKSKDSKNEIEVSKLVLFPIEVIDFNLQDFIFSIENKDYYLTNENFNFSDFSLLLKPPPKIS